jgi:hypothetical protein
MAQTAKKAAAPSPAGRTGRGDDPVAEDEHKAIKRCLDRIG